MQVGMIGLGRMGMNMTRRLLRGGHDVIAYNRTPDKVKDIARQGAKGAYSLEQLTGMLTPPRVLWLMVPAGKPVDDMIDSLKGLVTRGDIVVDGGNSYYKDDLRRE